MYIKMNRQKSLARIGELLSRFTAEVKISNSSNQYDINIHAENVLLPLLNSIYDLNLVNANFTQAKNYSSVDLIDVNNRVAFQITSTNTIQKIKDTVRQFIKDERYKSFDILYVYIITEKQKSYSSKLNEEVNGAFNFDINTHILDNTDLFRIVSSQTSIDRITKVEKVLENEFTESKIEKRKQLIAGLKAPVLTERIFPNLLEISFPAYIYIADVDIDKENITQEINEYLRSKRKRTYRSFKPRTLLKQALRSYTGKVGSDWVLYENRIISFRDLGKSSEPLSQVVDMGTVDKMRVEEFYATNENYLRVFKNLLRNSFLEKVKALDIEIAPESGIFRFKTSREVPRAMKVTWKAINTAQKTVVFELRNKAKTHIVCFKHLAFKAFFYSFGEKWYISLIPTWSFTNDGYRTSRFESQYLSGAKRMEGNESVYYYFRFLAYYLSKNEMFVAPYEYLMIMPAFSFRFAPIIEDKKWLPVKVKSDVKIDIEEQNSDNELNKRLFE